MLVAATAEDDGDPDTTADRACWMTGGRSQPREATGLALRSAAPLGFTSSFRLGAAAQQQSDRLSTDSPLWQTRCTASVSGISTS